MTASQGELLEVLCPGGWAVLRWSVKLHGKTDDRHAWAVKVAWLLHDHGPDAELPPFPSPRKSVREARERTVRRLFRQPPKPPEQVDPAYLPSRANVVATRDNWLRKFRDHQAGCQHCASSGVDRPADLPVGREARMDFICDQVVCTEGSILLHRPMQYQEGLHAGLYPERGEQKDAQPAAPKAEAEQLDLFSSQAVA